MLQARGSVYVSAVPLHAFRPSVHENMANLQQCDYAGVVEELGSGVTKALKRGDRVSGMAHGG